MLFHLGFEPVAPKIKCMVHVIFVVKAMVIIPCKFFMHPLNSPGNIFMHQEYAKEIFPCNLGKSKCENYPAFTK
jgi:hypothetical protein